MKKQKKLEKKRRQREESIELKKRQHEHAESRMARPGEQRLSVELTNALMVQQTKTEMINKEVKMIEGYL